MAGLSDIIANTATQTTTLPSWYDTAQQNIARTAGSLAGAAPSPTQTVGQQAVDILGGGANPFTTATNTAQQIASGAASPWMTDASGNVVPNTNTALGGLFAAQNQQLQQLLPNVRATPEAASIGSGQFGSLRGQTAVDKAMADAQAQLATQQMQVALTNQQTGVQAANAVGTLANANIQDLLTTGQYQQAAPFTNISNYAKILGSLQAPTTVSNTTQLSPLNQIAGLISALGGPTGTGGILGSLGITGGLPGIVQSVKDLFPSSSTDWAGGMTTGQTTDANGNIITDPTYGAAGAGTSYNPYAGTDTSVEP